jgi:putative transposase
MAAIAADVWRAAVHADLAAAGVAVSRKRVARLMRAHGLCGVTRRGAKRTTTPDSRTPPAPDRVKRRFIADQPNRLWVADITYIPTLEGWLFLAIVMDAWSRPAAGLVHHSDRGSQYTSLAFGQTLHHAGILASMASRGDAYDNAPAESCISTIKNELIHQHRFTTRDQARLATFDYIEAFYNPHRRHSKLGHKSPIEYEKITQPAANAA